MHEIMSLLFSCTSYDNRWDLQHANNQKYQHNKKKFTGNVNTS